MEKGLHQGFIDKLSGKYGDWQKETSKFGTHSYGDIAAELCISTSQFSKLISGTATDGMYIRSIRNIEQLVNFENLKQAHESLKNENQRLSGAVSDQAVAKSSGWKLTLLMVASALCLGAFLAHLFLKAEEGEKTSMNVPLSNHPLSVYFDKNFKADYVSPFLSVSEVQAFCPCSGYEGTWELENEYVIPMPGKKPGIYYLAKSSDVRMRCLRQVPENEKGKVLIAFENMRHEVWVDKTREPFSPRYFDEGTMDYTEEFHQLNFEEDSRFEKVADVHSFFIDRFNIEKDSIFRTGEPSGRYADIVNQELANEFEIDFKNLLEGVIGNMTITKCQPAINAYCDPNDLKEGESAISFDCNFRIKTENLGFGGGYPYSKGFRLVKQNYSANLLCGCE